MSGIVHAQLFFECTCRKCRRTVRALVHDYGELTIEDLDEKIGMHNFPVPPLSVPCAAGRVGRSMLFCTMPRRDGWPLG